MKLLVESKEASARGLKYLTCSECAGIDFRSPDDTVPFQPFKLYRDADGQVMKHLGANALFTGGDHVFVCIGCEKTREAAHRPGRELRLIAYDAKTLTQCEVPAPTA
jgi:hypothetical protein